MQKIKKLICVLMFFSFVCFVNSFAMEKRLMETGIKKGIVTFQVNESAEPIIKLLLLKEGKKEDKLKLHLKNTFRVHLKNQCSYKFDLELEGGRGKKGGESLEKYRDNIGHLVGTCFKKMKDVRKFLSVCNYLASFCVGFSYCPDPMIKFVKFYDDGGVESADEKNKNFNDCAREMLEMFVAISKDVEG